MLNSDSPQGGLYAPLSQEAMSDSESEEEEISYHRRHASLQSTISVRSMQDIHGSSLTNLNCDADERHNDNDNVAILGMNEKNAPMSPLRKLCFVLSLGVCFGLVIIFLWLIPCDEDSTCPAPADRIKTHNWLNNYTKVELKGLVNVVDGLRNWERNLIFMYRGDQFFPEFQPVHKKRNGIISLIGNSGSIAWFDEMIAEPISIDCSLFDADLNGKPDCLVIDEMGQLGVINPISGQWLWRFRDKENGKVDVLNFPIVLPDLNGDGVNEFFFATSNGEEARNYLRILSGRNGEPLGQGYKVSDCASINKFQLDNAYTISYNCVNQDTEIQRFKSLPELYSLTTNKSMGQKLTPASLIPQHKIYGQRKDTEAQRSIYSLNGKDLIIENRGKCPDSCNLTFTLSEKKNGKTNILQNFSGSKMYGMVPAKISFKTADGKSKLNGFVIKFWEWSRNDTADNKREKRDESSPKFESFNIFDSLILKRRSFTISSEDSTRPERSVANITKQKSSNILSNYKMRLIKETVVLVIFNSADIHIENTSQSNIVQFCRTEKSETVCQPDLNNQENSLMIADLDKDGSQELVSYYSTFISKSDAPTEWRLVTYVQILRLQSELPLFYEDVKRN